ncbi:hypothetical protein [Deinococcus peraridilitoris]|uniref:Uncharacterized protein n=1 Tax=Deinococcus peraridilitoris (strain DSM 19664 / LMG 22246 / CIP 109416 / KR-200) TaxID=937777 RepID=K9ZZK7_DEIPD|nr:hypothetical protein [Deinococcus peraridilitoris]AFZ66185.1 hypothetical protein Deipe_0595 [Deinococcus peraridilitoris DSM 19664]
MPSEDTQASAADALYAKKLGLAILSVLQDKGVLSSTDVNTILLAVNRSVQQSAKPSETGASVPQIDMEL